MALSYTESGNNTASSSWGVSHPAASTGDLLIFNIGWDDSTTTSGLTPPSGPNGETAVVIEDVRVSSSTSVRGKIVYYVATGSWSASTITFTPSASEQWSAVVIKVPAGEFDASTPIGADNYFESTTTDSTPDLPSLTAGSTDSGGTVAGFMVGDVDDADGTITGWTNRASTDRGAVGVDLWTRDTTATNSESISAATGATYPSARDYVSFIYIIRPNQPPTVSLNSPADASSTSDVTPALAFTGTDPESNDIRYNVQVDTVNTFDSGGTTSTSTYYFDGSDASASDPNSVWTNDANAFDGNTGTTASCSTNGSTSSNYLKAEGTNAPSSGGTIASVRAVIYASASAANTSAAIYTDGLGELLGTPTHTGSAGYGSYTTLSAPTGGWTWAKIQALEVKIYRTSGMSASLPAKVEVEVTLNGPLLNKVSGTDSGFSGSPDNSDPFASGQQVTYTTSGLLPDTYYWRVRAIDPSGGNAYGAFSSTRSFTITAADTLLGYDFTTNLAPTSTGTGVSGNTLSGGAGISTIDRNTSSTYSTEPQIDVYPNNYTTLVNAVSNNAYITFTITPDSGKKIDFQYLSFKAARGGATTPRGYGVYSSIDSYASSLGNADLTNVNPTWTDIVIDLNGASFQDVTSAVTFRIYVYTPNSGNSVDFDNIFIYGTVENSASTDKFFMFFP